MSNYYHELKIDVTNALRKDWVFPKPNGQKYKNGVWEFPLVDVMDPDWIKYVESLGIKLAVDIMLFYKPVFFNMLIDVAHIDVINGDENEFRHSSLNIIVGGEDSDMRWYEMPENLGGMSYTPANTPYLQWPVKKMVEVERKYIKQNCVTLVRTDIPHSITVHTKDRWCFAMTPYKNPEWNEVVKLIQEKNLLVD